MSTKLVKIQRPRLHHAGGFPICEGSQQYPKLRRNQIRPWRQGVLRFLQERVKACDAEVLKMIQDLACEIQTYDHRQYNQWPNLTPLEKQQALFRWIIDQARWKRRCRFSAIHILAAGIAGDLWTTYGPEPQLRTPYARAVNIARSVWFLFMRELKAFEHDDGHGNITTRTILTTKRVQIRSRYAAQRIEACIKKHAGWFLGKYGSEIAAKILR